MRTLKAGSYLVRLGVLVLAALFAVTIGAGRSDAGETKLYVVLFSGQETADGSFQIAASPTGALSVVQSAGGEVYSDLTSQIGVAIVGSSNAVFRDALLATGVVEEVGEDFSWKAFDSYEEAVASGAVISGEAARGGGGRESSTDAFEPLQWDMAMMRTSDARAVQAGWRAVDVGVLDTGIDALHLDFDDDGVAGGSTNVDCARGRNSIIFLPAGGGLGNPDPCVDNGFHGTHVAGTIAAQANNYGMVGVAPNVTLVPVKVCDTTGFCYAHAAIDGITYAGDQQFDVINMSFFVDDEGFQESTRLKCMDDPVQRAYRVGVERAIKYAIKHGVTPVAAIGNDDEDMAANDGQKPDCAQMPQEVEGVTSVVALGPKSEKARYSSYGYGVADVSAPGGNGRTGDCTTTIFSAFPANSYFCIQGTSMASPHAAGVAALIVSQFGRLGADGDVKMPSGRVADYLEETAIDIGLTGYDKCFGHGRVDALRAVEHDTSTAYDASAPFCPEYAE